MQVDITEDQTTPDQLRDSFRGIASDKVSFHLLQRSQCSSSFSQPFVTELDLRIAHLSGASIDYLREAMPRQANEVGESEFDYERWLDDVFA